MNGFHPSISATVSREHLQDLVGRAEAFRAVAEASSLDRPTVTHPRVPGWRQFSARIAGV